MTGGNINSSNQGWLIQPTVLMRKKRRERSLSILLRPPAGYTGRIRFGIIDDIRREEVTAAWQNGFDTSVPRSLRETTSHSGTSTDYGWPIVITAALDQEDLQRSLNIHILMEQLPVDSNRSQPKQPFTSSVTIKPVLMKARIFLLPLLPLEPENNNHALNLVKAALAAAARTTRLRLGVPDTYLPLIQSSRYKSRLIKLQTNGQLDLLSLSEPATSLADFTGLQPPRLKISLPSSPVSGTRKGLTQHLSGFDDHSFVSFQQINPATNDEAPLFLSVDQALHCSPFNKGLTPYITDQFDRIIRSAAENKIEATLDSTAQLGKRSKKKPAPILLGFYPFFLDHPDDWTRLAGQIGRWNRTYASPQLVAATPSDLLSLCDALSSVIT